MNMEPHDSTPSNPGSDTPTEAAVRRGIIALAPFFVVMSRIIGGLLTVIGLLLVVAGIAGTVDESDGANSALVLAIVGFVIALVGLITFFGGPRYARTVRRYHGAES